MAYAPKFLTLPADRPRISRLICFALGGLTTLSFAPFEVSLLAPLAALPLLFVCLTVSPRDAGAHAFWYGFGLFLTGTYWIYISVVVFGEAPTWIALLLMLGLTLIMSFWLFAAGWFISRLTHGEPLLLVAVAPSAWVVVEWLRGWVLSGFPWLALGYSNIDTVLAGWAPVAGVYGVSFMLIASAAAALAAIILQGRSRWVAVGLMIGPWLLGGILGVVSWTEEDGTELKVTILQAGIPQDQKWLRENRQPTLDYYRDTTRIAYDSDIVVWPEVAIPSLSSREGAYLSQLQSDARENGYSILFGILEDHESRGERRIYNSVLMLDGERRQVYRKRHLVPFGEYFPVPAKIREWMRMMSLPHSDISAGSNLQEPLQTRAGVRLAVLICYEDAYGAEQRQLLPEAAVLINVSNDAWFGDSIAPHQHLQIARMRSLEFGRPTIRATNTGISAFIDHTGEIVREGAQFQEVTMSARIRPRRGSTPYVASGNTPIVTICLIILGLSWWRSRH